MLTLLAAKHVRLIFSITALTIVSWISLPTLMSRAQDNENWAQRMPTVSAQPLAANVKRLMQTMPNIGFPLGKSQMERIDTAIESGDAKQIQLAIDKLVSLVVEIQTDAKTVRKSQIRPLQLVQNEHQALIVKVLNKAETRNSLAVYSPQAGAVYSGTSLFSLQRQQQTELGKNLNDKLDQHRYLDLEIYGRNPLQPRLSGLEVEYVVLLIHCNRRGKLSPEVAFYTQPENKPKNLQEILQTGSLSRLSLKVTDARPVRFLIDDPTQQSLHPIARIEIRDASGRVYPNQPKRRAPDLFFQPQIYRRDGEFVYLAPGQYSIRYCRGPEYRLLQKELTVKPQEVNEWKLSLERWIQPEQFGFYSGDHHIHAAGCSHYTAPTQGMKPTDMYRQVTGEGLNVGCILTWGPCFEHQRNYFDPQASHFENRETIVKYDIEVSGFGSQALGHVCLLNLSDQTYPQSEGTKTKGWPTWTTPVMRWAKNQGGYTGYAHSASGLEISPAQATNRIFASCDKDKNNQLDETECQGKLLPFNFSAVDTDKDQQISRGELLAAHRISADQLPNFSIPEMNGVGAMEICVSAAEGVCDFISSMDTARIQEWNTWYHLLNCGFDISVSGETDFPCMSSRRVGKGRVYVNMGQKLKEQETLSFSKWCENLAKGRSYVSDGFAHATEFKVEGVQPGFSPVELRQPGKVKLNFSVAFAPQTPNAVAHGTQSSPIGKRLVGDTVELHHPREHQWITGGTRQVEIVVNGQPIEKISVKADGRIHSFEKEIKVDRSSWIAIRQFPQLHTNPVKVLVDRKPIRVSRKSALWCIGMTELLWQNRQRTIAVAERPEAQETFAKALARFAKIAAEADEKR